MFDDILKEDLSGDAMVWSDSEIVNMKSGLNLH